jgi:hypothetical protein
MEKVQRKWILGSLAIALASGAALWPSPSPASERAEALVHGGPFEGTITITMDSTAMPKPATTTYDFKGRKVRFAGPRPSADFPESTVIVDQESRKSWLVVDERRTILTLDAGKAMDDWGAAAQVSTNVAVEKTGTFDVVAGYRCEKWEITAGSEHISACVLAGLDVSGAPMAVAGADGLAGEKAFPLRAIHTDAKGVVTRHLEVRKIERAAIDDSRFALPEGYSVEDALKAVEQAEQR